MDWISWSRIWSTRSTTTTSRKPLQRRRKYFAFASRTKAKAKARRPSIPLLPHLQELYLFVKEYGLILNQELNPIKRTSGKKTKHSSSAWTITSRRRWCDRILEIKRLSSVRIWALSALVWRYVEEQDGRRRRRKEKVSKLCWPVRTRNYLPPSSSRSFRTQSHWSYTAGQCVNSEQFLRVHLSLRMCDQFTFHHNFRIDTGRTNFEQKTDGILYVCGSLWTKNTEIWIILTWKHSVLHGTSRKNWRNIKIRCIGSTSDLLNRKDLSSIKHDRTQSSFTTHSQLIVSRRLSWWKLEKSYTRKYMRHLDLLRRFPLKTIGWKNWVQKLLEEVKSEQPSVRLLRKAKKVSCLAATAPTLARGDLWRVVPVSVERLSKDKDADENVDADQISTEGPVSVQPTGLFMQREEIDIDFRVSGLPHAVVKRTENFRVRELVKKIESHPHREALQADLQQNNVYNPFRDDSKAMIREMGNVELFELCETIPKVQCSDCFLCWNQGIVYCTCGHLLVESESSQTFSQWRLDAFSIENFVIKKERPRGARHGRTEAQKEHFIAHNARKRCFKMKFEGIHDRFLKDSTYRDSQLKICWTEEKCIDMDKLAQENHSYCPSPEEFERYKKNWYISLNKSGKNAPMKLRSYFREAVSTMNRLHRESGEERPEPIPSYQYQRWATDRQYSLQLNPMNKDHRDPQELDLTKRRLASYKQKWKRHQDTVYWIDIQLAQNKGFKFYQTRSNAIILYDTLPAYCIPAVVVMESGEIIYEKVCVSPRPPPKISYKDNWMNELDSEVAGSSKDTQRFQPKPQTQLSRTVKTRGRTRVHKGNRERYLVWSRGRQALNKNGETRMWIKIHKKLRADTCRNWRRSNKNGETRKGGGARHWLQSTRTVTYSCERSRNFPSSRACKKDRK